MDERFKESVESSSLGSDEARELRQLVTDEQAVRILARAQEIEEKQCQTGK